MPKKTLDDYYSILKKGEELGFQFENNLKSKIGVLRDFIFRKTNGE